MKRIIEKIIYGLESSGLGYDIDLNDYLEKQSNISRLGGDVDLDNVLYAIVNSEIIYYFDEDEDTDFFIEIGGNSSGAIDGLLISSIVHHLRSNNEEKLADLIDCSLSRLMECIFLSRDKRVTKFLKKLLKNLPKSNRNRGLA